MAAWCVVAAFGTYACMYGFRKPFTAAGFESPPFGPGFKALLVMCQVLGYAASKWVGIRIIAEMPPSRRAATLIGLVGLAELALLLFGLLPPSLGAAMLFLNGLSLGLVFGLVLGFLEGRRLTEAFVAGLCASFILADGATKSAGAALLGAGVPERWMPSVCGLLFLGPLLGFVAMLSRIPPPSSEDQAERRRREPLDGPARRAFLRRHAGCLVPVIAAYLVITVLRSLRADFAPELWRALDGSRQPSVFTLSELWVALGVLVVNGLTSLIRGHRRALLLSLGICAAGMLLTAGVLAAQHEGRLSAFPFMVLLGLGLYLPYVAVHTTVFERLIALTRGRGNVGHLMYVADAAGYLGYVGVMLLKSAGGADQGILPLTRLVGGAGSALALSCFLIAAFVVMRILPDPQTSNPELTLARASVAGGGA